MGKQWRLKDFRAAIQSQYFIKRERKSDSIDISYNSTEEIFASADHNPFLLLMSSFHQVPGNWLAEVGDALVGHLENGIYDSDSLLEVFSLCWPWYVSCDNDWCRTSSQMDFIYIAICHSY